MILLKLEFDGFVYELGHQKESPRKPRERLVYYGPPFKHLSSLYKVEKDEDVYYLFDDGKKAYRWINLEDPKAYIEIPATEYLSLKSDWFEQQKYKLSQKKKEEEAENKEGSL